ncbi:MAG: Cell division topological specificity factor [Pseudomonadota bacterium]
MATPGFLRSLFGEKKPTANIAKERLQLILAHERIGRNAPAMDFLPQLQRELIAVISKYVAIDTNDIKIEMSHQDSLDVLNVQIELPDRFR